MSRHSQQRLADYLGHILQATASRRLSGSVAWPPDLFQALMNINSDGMNRRFIANS